MGSSYLSYKMVVGTVIAVALQIAVIFYDKKSFNEVMVIVGHWSVVICCALCCKKYNGYEMDREPVVRLTLKKNHVVDNLMPKDHCQKQSYLDEGNNKTTKPAQTDKNSVVIDMIELDEDPVCKLREVHCY